MRLLAAAVLLALGLSGITAAAVVEQRSAPTQIADSRRIALWVDTGETHPGSPTRPATGTGQLTVYLPSDPHANIPAVIICPGGGYTFLAVAKEGTKPADRLAADGIAAFVLEYRLPKGRTPAPGEVPVPEQDVLRAVQLVRSRAAEWNVDPHRVGVMGFSAGGHVAAMAATMFDDAKSLPAAPDDPIGRVSARPDFAVLLYPVISMEPAWAHTGSHAKLLGKAADAAAAARFSVDERVTPQTPPLFIAVAKDDKTVEYHNSELMADAAKRAGVPAKLMIFDHGGHGFGLGDNADTRTWYPACMAWLQTQGVLKMPDGSPK